MIATVCCPAFAVLPFILIISLVGTLIWNRILKQKLDQATTGKADGGGMQTKKKPLTDEDIKSIEFADVFDLKRIQNVQDTFAKGLGVALVVTDADGVPIVKTSNESHLYSKIIATSKKGLHTCLKLDVNLSTESIDKPAVGGGIWGAYKPVYVGKKHVANWHIGQVADKNMDEFKMMDFAREIGADEAKFRAALKALPVMSMQQFKNVCDALAMLVDLETKDALADISINRATQLTVEAQAASMANSNFLSNMSHEIRTSMNGIIGSSNLLFDSELNEEQQEMALTITQSSAALLGILKDALDYYDMEAGNFKLKLTNFNLKAALDQLMDPLSIHACRREENLTCRIEPNVPLLLRGDVEHICQIVVNLLGNAIKFTHKGDKITLRVSLEAEDEKQAHIRFSVTDTGDGIAPEDLENIFEAAKHLGSTKTCRHGGSGLGLSLCKHLAELMGGKIGVESELGRGSTFWFTAFIAKQTGTEKYAEAVTEDESKKPTPKVVLVPEGSSFHLLVVEDNRLNQNLAIRMLKKIGCTADAVSDGKQALKILETKKYDKILMDVQMPVMDGFEATRRLRQMEKEKNLPHTPVIAMTAHALTGDRKRCLDAGMDDYISKPVNLRELSEKVFALPSSSNEEMKKEEEVDSTSRKNEREPVS